MDLPAPVSPENTVKRAEMDLGLFDDDEVADMQGAQHGGANYSTLSVACGIGFQCSLRRRVEKKL